jgi:hypothetical protein
VNARREPPPIVDDNPPSPPRQPPPEPPAPSTVEPTAPRWGSSILDAVAGDWDGLPSDSSARVMAGLVGLRRKPVDPMTDYVADGTRIPRFIKDAMMHEAALTGRSCQEIMRDALLGVRPLSPELLDAHYIDLYGEPRRGGHDD